MKTHVFYLSLIFIYFLLFALETPKLEAYSQGDALDDACDVLNAFVDEHNVFFSNINWTCQDQSEGEMFVLFVATALFDAYNSGYSDGYDDGFDAVQLDSIQIGSNSIDVLLTNGNTGFSTSEYDVLYNQAFAAGQTAGINSVDITSVTADHNNERITVVLTNSTTQNYSNQYSDILDQVVPTAWGFDQQSEWVGVLLSNGNQFEDTDTYEAVFNLGQASGSGADYDSGYSVGFSQGRDSVSVQSVSTANNELTVLLTNNKINTYPTAYSTIFNRGRNDVTITSTIVQEANSRIQTTLSSGLVVNNTSVFAEIYQIGLDEASEDALAITTFIPIIFSTVAAFFFQVMSINILGFSLLQFFALLLSVWVLIIFYRMVVE